MDAEPQEAANIARALATPGGHLSIGHAGNTLHFGDGCNRHGDDDDRMKALCVAAGLPVIDSRQVPFAVFAEIVMRGPMVAVGRLADPPPWHALAVAPLDHVASLLRAAGAEVINLPHDPREEASS